MPAGAAAGTPITQRHCFCTAAPARVPTVGQVHQGELLRGRPVQQNEGQVVGRGGLVLWQLNVAGVGDNARSPPQLVLVLRGRQC